MSTYCCPKCKSPSVHRSRRRGLYEHVVVRLALMRPYRCWSCTHRYYGYLFLRKHPGNHAYASTSLTLLHQMPRAIPLLPLLLFVPWALASTGSDLMLLGLTFSNRPSTSATMPEVFYSAQSTPHVGSQIHPVGFAMATSTANWQAEQPVPAQGKPSGEPELSPSRPAPMGNEALGTVTSSGNATLNGAQVPQMATIYSGDALVTGVGGNAVIKIQGIGQIQVSPETLVKLSNAPQYIAQLEYGQISSRSLGQAALRVRVGNFVVTPEPGSVEATVNLSVGADSVAHVKSVQGSVRVSSLEGPQTSVLQSGQEISFASRGGVGGSMPSSIPTLTAGTGGSHAGLILAGAGIAGGVGAAVALSGGNNSGSPGPISPFRP